MARHRPSGYNSRGRIRREAYAAPFQKARLPGVIRRDSPRAGRCRGRDQSFRASRRQRFQNWPQRPIVKPKPGSGPARQRRRLPRRRRSEFMAHGSVYWAGLKGGDSYSMEERSGTGLVSNNSSGVTQLRWGWETMAGAGAPVSCAYGRNPAERRRSRPPRGDRSPRLEDGPAAPPPCAGAHLRAASAPVLLADHSAFCQDETAKLRLLAGTGLAGAVTDLRQGARRHVSNTTNEAATYC